MKEALLGELVRSAGGRAGSEVDLPVYSVTKHAGFVPSLEYFKKQVFSRDVQSYKLVQPGDFAYSTIHLDEGAIGIAPERSLISPMYTVFHARRELVDPSYLLRYLKSPRAMSSYERLGKGAVHRRKAISLEALGSLTVPLPDLDEQRRIAAILDEADNLRATTAARLIAIGALHRSVFRSMFGPDCWRAVTATPPDSERSGWRWELLSDVARLATGHTPDRKRPEYWDGDIPWISLPEIRRLDGCEASDTDLRITAEGIRHSSAVVLPAGTVAFSRTASIGFVTKLGRPMATSQDFHNWVPGNRLDPDFLMAALRYSRAHLLASSDGSTHRTIYQRVAEGFWVLMPPIGTQRRFAAFSQAIDSQREGAQRSRVEFDELFASLEARAFSAQL